MTPLDLTDDEMNRVGTHSRSSEAFTTRFHRPEKRVAFVMRTDPDVWVGLAVVACFVVLVFLCGKGVI